MPNDPDDDAEAQAKVAKRQVVASKLNKRTNLDARVSSRRAGSQPKDRGPQETSVDT